MTDIAAAASEFLLYQTEDGHARVDVRFAGDTVWLSIGQMAELFQRDRSVISRHIKNVFDEGELGLEATVANLHQFNARDSTKLRAKWSTSTST